MTVRQSVKSPSDRLESNNGCSISLQVSNLQTETSYDSGIGITKPATVFRRRKRGSEFSPTEFWQYVHRSSADACWPWTDTVLAWNGYGYFWYPVLKRSLPAHRVAWLLTHGDTNGFHVLHRCDNPPCCNPAHLWLGTHTDNMRDCIAKGRRSLDAHGRKHLS